MLRSYRHSQCGIPSNSGMFPSTKKKLHQYSMPLLIHATLHMPLHGMHELLYASGAILLLMDLFSSLMFVC